MRSLHLLLLRHPREIVWPIGHCDIAPDQMQALVVLRSYIPEPDVTVEPAHIEHDLTTISFALQRQPLPLLIGIRETLL